MTIETCTGGVVTSGAGSLDVFAFYRKSAKDKEQPLHLAMKDRASDIKPITNSLDIVQSGAKRTGKFWSRQRANYPDGSFIKLMVLQRGKTSHNIGTSMMMLRARDGAPLQRVSISLPTDQSSALSVVHIEGRFDVLTTKQVVELGVNRNGQGLNDLANYPDEDEEYDETLFTITVLEQATAPVEAVKVKVVNKSGTAGGRAILRQRRVRHIRT